MEKQNNDTHIPYNGILLSNKKEQTTDTRNMDESKMHYDQFKKPDSKVYMVNNYIYEGKTIGAINKSVVARG